MSDEPTRSVPPADRPTADPPPPDGPTRDANAPTAGLSGEPIDAIPPPAPPGYELLEVIGSGGMGVVYRARELALNRHVAVKVLQPRFPADGAAAVRFVEEAQITGQLQHPGIPPVHQVGTLTDGRPFLVMKLIKGRTLEELLKERAGPAADRGRFLAVFEQVCQAVACAHDRKVIHRDLKPANVMVGSFGEVQVMDWGLAKLLTAPGQKTEAIDDGPAGTVIRTARDSEGSFTVAGSVLGTPAYMPPEQAGGEIDRIDERADVFGLGAILCVVLTGRPPFVAKDAEAIRLMAIRGQLADCLTRLDGCGAEPELVALCKKCLAADPADRPRHAGEVAKAVAGLRAAAEDRAKRAELDRAAAEARATEQRKRRKVQAALGLVFTALVVLAGTFVWWQDRQAAEREREDAGRRAAAERDVNRAVEDAVAKFGRATGAGRDPGLWAEARAAALHADARAADADAPPEVRDRTRKLVAEVEQAEKNRRLVATLLEIQAGMGDTCSPDGTQDFPGADARYARAFRDYGTDLFTIPPGQGAELLRAMGGGIHVQLAAAIDDWGYVRFALAGKLDQTARLFQATRLLDPDPMRNRIRDIVAARDDPALNRLAAELDPAAQPVQTVNLVAVYLAWFQRGEGNKAASRFLRKAQPHHPGDFQINLNLAFFLSEEGRYAEALPYAAAAVAVRPGSVAARQQQAVALAGLGRKDEAAAAYHRICTLSPNATFANTGLITLLTRAGDRERANAVLGDLARVYREAIRHDPTDAALHHNLAQALHALGDLDGAIPAYQDALRAARKNAEAAHYTREARDHLWTALVQKRTRPGTDGHAAALAAFGEMTRFDPTDPWPHVRLANHLRAKGDLNGAIARCREATRLDPGYPWGHRLLGDILLGERDFIGAAASFRETARLQPNDPWPHTKLGLALAGQRDWDGAIAAHREAVRLGPKNPVAHNDLGNALRQAGRLDEAEAAYREAVRLDGDHHGAAIDSLARLLAGQGDMDGAAAVYREIIRLDPKYARAHNNLAWLLATWPEAGLRDGKRAVELATRACELTGWKDPIALDTLAAAYAEAEDFGKAVECQKKALGFLDKEDGADFRKRLDLYGRKRPYREAVRPVAPPPRAVTQ